MTQISFSEERSHYVEHILPLLLDIRHIKKSVKRTASIDPEIAHLFSDEFSRKREVYTFEKEIKEQQTVPKTIGVFFSGGQAPGGHAVLSGLVDSLSDYHPSSRCVGFLGGPKGLLSNRFREITREEAFSIRHTGGFDFLGSGRDAIKGEDAFETALKVSKNHSLDGIVIIGGDDSHTNSLLLSDYFERKKSTCSIVGVPKTIDDDLRAPELSLTFGFDTATKTYSESIGNIAKDVLSAKKQYFFIRLMGRHTSHITLECALQTHPNLALISEEIQAKKMTLHQVVISLCDLVEERLMCEKQYGVFLIPEGLIEHMIDVRSLLHEINALPALLFSVTEGERRYEEILALLSESSRATFVQFPRNLGLQLLQERDPHGNVIVSKIETEKVLALLVEHELYMRSKHDGKLRPFSFQTFFCGYEGRAQYPTDFDLDYSLSLGRLAGCAVFQRLNGYLVAIDHLERDSAFWKPCCIPLLSMATIEMRHGRSTPVIQKAPVDLLGSVFSHFVGERELWRCHDDYQQPGPIQYWRKETTLDRPLSILIKKIEEK